jgi:hypothetical protein
MIEMTAGPNAPPLPYWARAKIVPDIPTAEPPEDWGKVDSDLVKEVVRQAELNLQQQAAVAQSYDQRATSLAALANAGAVAVLAFLGSQIAQGHADAALIAGCVSVAVAWCASAVCSYLALAPASWRSAGFWPSQLYRGVLDGGYELREALGSLAEQLDQACRTNDRRNARAATMLRWALSFAGAAPIIGAVFWTAANFHPWVAG